MDIYKRKKQQIIEEKRKKRKLDEKTALYFLFAIIVYFILIALSGTQTGYSPTSSNSGYQEKSCVDKHKEDYQAYLYCARVENLNR